MIVLMNILMLSCKKASELIDRKPVAELSVIHNVMLHMHTAMCSGCKAYQKQSKVLDELLRQYLHKVDDSQIPQFTHNQLKQQIISML